MRHKTTLLILLLFTLLLCSSVFAEQQSLGTFEKDRCINLLQTCANCTFVNITSVKYPNSSILLGNVEMTKQGTEYNFTICNASVLGDYIVNGVGDVDGVNTVWAYDFKVTMDGYENDMPTGVIIGMSLLGIILVGIGFYLIGGNNVK